MFEFFERKAVSSDLFQIMSKHLTGYGNFNEPEYWHEQTVAEGVALSAKSLEDFARSFEWSDTASTKNVEHFNEDVGAPFLKQSIAQKGWAGTVTVAMMMVVACMPTREIANQFFLEELDVASRGNEASQKAVRRSGIPAQEYRGALERSLPAVNGPGGPQQLLMGLSSQFAREPELMAKFRGDVGHAVQEYFQLGNWATD